MATMAEVQEFIRVNDVDEGAAAALRAAGPDVQAAVLARGDVSNARNPSSALMMRIKDAKASGLGGLGGAPAPANHSAGADDWARTANPAGGGIAAAPTAPSAGLTMPATTAAPAAVNTAIYDPYAAYAAAYGAAYAGQYSAYAAAYGLTGAGAAYNPYSTATTSAAALAIPAAVADALNAAGGTYVKMRGLPFSATKEDILKFFDGFRLSASLITLCSNSDGRPSGEAYVQFPTEAVAQEAVRERNKQRMEHRYIELFMSSANELQRALTKGASGGGVRATPY